MLPKYLPQEMGVGGGGGLKIKKYTLLIGYLDSLGLFHS